MSAVLPTFTTISRKIMKFSVSKWENLAKNAIFSMGHFGIKICQIVFFSNLCNLNSKIDNFWRFLSVKVLIFYKFVNVIKVVLNKIKFQPNEIGDFWKKLQIKFTCKARFSWQLDFTWNPFLCIVNALSKKQ